MILQQYYEQKKEKIDSIVNAESNRVRIGLYSDRVFDEEDEDEPVIMFKYNDVVWNTSSEKEYKADVDFSVYIVLNDKFERDYIESFEIARQVDEAILLHPNRSEIIINNEAIADGETEIELIKNSALKVKECQYTVEEDHWKKNNFYIWKITYKTTLIEKEYKKRYTMISNGAFNRRELEQKEEQVRVNLRKLGYDLDDYNNVEYNGKQLLVLKNVKEKLTINKDKKVTLKG
ncbi:hypothetical protein D1816_04855 [Aquimarina sp. AD10]|uniref:hypothetical protein n=1 Tax=Aquimarina sp. AD10 TaxID=1714849 RepID=UPI000E4A8D43|nr:hypothetical protein [Aquimarina sp. AD10]AXT59712.1 hypothetical protein D1816_04855 [Aquimarina sp. AD10]RKM97588.1 hypothetical protein D7033_14435 [Aquimarina sp. AD10]